MTRVALHGDFGPGNLLMAPSGMFCLDADLAHEDDPVHDIARFVVMLFDAAMFVVGEELPYVRRLRRQAAATFVHAYYGEQPWCTMLQSLVMEDLLARWSTRAHAVRARGDSFTSARAALVDHYFARLVDEVGDDDWLGRMRRRDPVTAPDRRPISVAVRSTLSRRAAARTT